MIEQRVRQLQLIVFALIQGSLIFSVLAAWLASQHQAQPPPDNELLRIGAWVLFVVVVLASNLVPHLVVRQQLRRLANGQWPISKVPGISADWLANDEGKLLQVFVSQTILLGALLEGVAFLGCIATIMTARYETLIIPGVAVVLMIVHVPLAPKVRAWIDQHQAQLAGLRAGRL